MRSAFNLPFKNLWYYILIQFDMLSLCILITKLRQMSNTNNL